MRRERYLREYNTQTYSTTANTISASTYSLTAFDWTMPYWGIATVYNGSSTANGWTLTNYPQPAVAYQRPIVNVPPALPPPRLPARRTGDALQRSKDLLMSCLTEAQRDSLERFAKFRCVSDVGDVYEIEAHRMHNIFLLDAQGRRVQEWCVTPCGNFPVYDVMLAQKLALETDSSALADQANITDLRSGRMIRQADRQYTPFAEADYLRLAAG